jgi:peptidoglycan biosynthesis protein MviN/MurJ (putative lipid II flippase)
VVIVGLLYGGGAMAPHALNATAEALDGYLPGVLGGLLAMLLARAWVVEGRAGRFLAAAVASVAVNGLVGAFATERFGVRGTAWGTSAGLWTLALLAGRGLGAPVWRALPPRAWAWAGAVNLLAWGAAVATRSAPPPDRIDAPRLWGAAFGLVSLLAIAGARAKRGP